MGGDNILRFESQESSVDPSELVLKEVKGREAMSSLYRYELFLEHDKEGGLASEEIDGLLSQPCVISQQRRNDAHEIHGVLRTIELLGANEEKPVPYRAVLVPRLWMTTLSFRTRVYQDKSVQEIVDEVLDLNGLTAEWSLAEDYPTREYTVQYAESDFNFISRLLEEWGIFYFFRQQPDGEELVIADNDAIFETSNKSGTLTFNPRKGRSNVKHTVHSLKARHRRRPSQVTLRDYNYRTPGIVLQSEHAVDTRSGAGTQWHYGDHFLDDTEGDRLARIRAEQMLNVRETYRGICTETGLAPGHKFELVDCPIPDLNITYLVTEVQPSIAVSGDDDDESYQYPFKAVAIRKDEPEPVDYVGQLKTPKPRIAGFIHGVIDGEVAGMAAPIDREGRYKVLLPMDDAAAPGGKASRWIRMLQPHAGAGFGMHFPLYIGTEVAIIHLDGDPDRPVIAGAAPNPDTISPIVEDDATRDRIKTRSGVMIEIHNDAP